jgi:hypothetical protein
LQAFRPNWFCVLGSLDPNGNPPVIDPDHPAPGTPAGFRCDEKLGPGIWWLTVQDQTTQPPGGAQFIAFEVVSCFCPAVGEVGLFAMFALFAAGGVWMVSRRAG